MITSKTLAAKPTPPCSDVNPKAFHLLSSLLHSVRRIAQHEDELCILTEAAKRGPMSAAAIKELDELLYRLPGQEYLDEMTALRALPGFNQSHLPRRKSAKRAAKKSPQKSTSRKR